MAYREYPTDPRLEGWARSFWEAEEFHGARTEQHVFMPERTVRLTFSNGTSHFNFAGRLEPIASMSLFGMNLDPVPMLSSGPTRSFGVELYPWSAQQLFGWHIEHSYLDLIGAHQRVAHEVQGLLSLKAWEDARESVTSWLLGLIETRGRERSAGVHAAITLYQQKGNAKIADLAEAQNLSPRQLERLFASDIGLSAKTLSRLIRFEEVCDRLYLEPGVSLSALAFDLGFADQAHLTREFRAFSRMTPKTFARISELRRVDATVMTMLVWGKWPSTPPTQEGGSPTGMSHFFKT